MATELGVEAEDSLIHSRSHSKKFELHNACACTSIVASPNKMYQGVVLYLTYRLLLNVLVRSLGSNDPNVADKDAQYHYAKASPDTDGYHLDKGVRL